MKSRFFLIFLLNLLLVAGCNQSVQLRVESDVPIPVVNQYPLTVGVYYTDEFRNFVYTEDSEDRPNWKIESGPSQVQLFNQILPSMFQTVQEVKNSSSDGYAATLQPRIEEMQFAMPQETKTDLYEVWIKYQMMLFDQSGQVIADWPVTGYGKSSTEFMKSRDSGLNTAFNQALRDAGAKFALNFNKNNDVRQWLADSGACNAENNLCQ